MLLHPSCTSESARKLCLVCSLSTFVDIVKEIEKMGFVVCLAFGKLGISIIGFFMGKNVWECFRKHNHQSFPVAPFFRPEAMAIS